MIQVLFFLLLLASLMFSPAVALFTGIAFALIFRPPHPTLSKKVAKYLLQASVVGLGFGMNLHESLQSSREGMLMTIVSVSGVMLLGYLVGRLLKVDRKLTHLIASGTAICGGSAIAAIAPVVRADENQTSMSLAVIFTLNAIALFIFPAIGHTLELTQQQFGMWAAIAIHDTSSVVGAAAAYGEQALMVATTVKLTRALWIIPLALVSVFLFPRTDTQAGKQRISIPWFIFLFIGAMILNTYLPLSHGVAHIVARTSHIALSATLFLIGTGLSVAAIRQVGARPVLLGIGLWIVISLFSLGVVLL